jgi:hypothetical protein
MMAPIFNMGIFFGIFFYELSYSSGVLEIVAYLHILEEQTPKKNKKICCPKINSKWVLNSRWLPKQNFLVKTTNHL